MLSRCSGKQEPFQSRSLTIPLYPPLPLPPCPFRKKHSEGTTYTQIGSNFGISKYNILGFRNSKSQNLGIEQFQVCSNSVLFGSKPAAPSRSLDAARRPCLKPNSPCFLAMTETRTSQGLYRRSLWKSARRPTLYFQEFAALLFRFCASGGMEFSKLGFKGLEAQELSSSEAAVHCSTSTSRI